MSLKHHLLTEQDGRHGKTACGVAIQRNPQLHGAAGQAWDVIKGKISRGCIAMPARDFEPYPNRACAKCCEAYALGAGI